MTADERLLAAAREIVAHVADHLQADLSVRLWNGEVLPLGPGARDDIQIVIADPAAVRTMALKPGLGALFALASAGRVRIEGGSPMQAADHWDHGRLVHLARRIDNAFLLRRLWPFLWSRPRALEGEALGFSGDDGVGRDAGERRDQAYVEHHYDVGNDFYRLFLDERMIYSCAYFPREDAGLDEAQAEKLDRICRKLRLKPGQRLLDIGCGWGGLAIWAAGNYGVQVHGVTLSPSQLALAQEAVRAAGLENRITLELRDYRAIAPAAQYDAVCQVGMFEHVGIANHDAFFQSVLALLKPGGLYFHQAITRRGGKGRLRPTRSSKAIARYIFPGGELDTIGMTTSGMGRNGLEVLDVENMREHYALTLRQWSDRLYANRAEAAALAGEGRTRLWLIYLAASAVAFERGAALLYQTVARKRRPGRSGLPLDRASLYEPRPPASNAT